MFKGKIMTINKCFVIMHAFDACAQLARETARSQSELILTRWNQKGFVSFVKWDTHTQEHGTFMYVLWVLYGRFSDIRCRENLWKC